MEVKAIQQQHLQDFDMIKDLYHLDCDFKFVIICSLQSTFPLIFLSLVLWFNFYIIFFQYFCILDSFMKVQG